MNCTPPGSSVHGIFQARILEWVAVSYSRGSSQAREADSLPLAPPGKPIYLCMGDMHKCTHIHICKKIIFVAVTIKSVNRVYLVFFLFLFYFETMFISKDIDISSNILQSNKYPGVKVQKKFLFKTPRIESSFGHDPVRQLNHLPCWYLSMEHLEQSSEGIYILLNKSASCCLVDRLDSFIHEHSFN